MSSKYRLGGLAALTGRSPRTVRCWEREGRIIAKRTQCGHRYFDESGVLTGLKPSFYASKRLTVAYCRVSSPEQKTDLEAWIAATGLYEHGLTGGGR